MIGGSKCGRGGIIIKGDDRNQNKNTNRRSSIPHQKHFLVFSPSSLTQEWSFIPDFLFRLIPPQHSSGGLFENVEIDSPSPKSSSVKATTVATTLVHEEVLLTSFGPTPYASRLSSEVIKQVGHLAVRVSQARSPQPENY